MSCGRHWPFALEPSGIRMTTHVNVVPGQRLASTRPSSMIR
jgi:hypothetical protein